MLTPKQAARYLNLSVSWLAKRRLAGDGPPYIKLGGAVRYAEGSLQQWMKGQQRTSTSGSSRGRCKCQEEREGKILALFSF